MALNPTIAGWFEQKGWSPRQHQLDVLDAYEAGASAMLIAPTGAGKTLAGFLPTLGLVGGAASEMGLPFVGAMMFLGGAGLALSRGLLERVVDGQEGTALRAEAD